MSKTLILLIVRKEPKKHWYVLGVGGVQKDGDKESASKKWGDHLRRSLNPARELFCERKKGLVSDHATWASKKKKRVLELMPPLRSRTQENELGRNLSGGYIGPPSGLVGCFWDGEEVKGSKYSSKTPQATKEMVRGGFKWGALGRCAEYVERG